MISDVLWEARQEILRYLVDFDCYNDPEYRRAIAEAVAAMDRLRLSPGFDIPPDTPEAIKIDDPMQYLSDLLAEYRADVVELKPRGGDDK